MAQTNRDPQRRRRTGAYATGEDTARRRPGWLIPLLALLGLLLLGFLLWLVLHDRGSDSPTTSAAATLTQSAAPTASVSGGSATASVTASPSSGAAGSGTAADGELLAGGETVLPLAGGSADLGRYAGQTATARSVTVQSVPADEGFWVGTSATDRVWVQLTGAAGESPETVKPGDRVSFATGKLVATPAGFADKVGVSAAEGAAQLSAQKAHVEVAKNALKLNA